MSKPADALSADTLHSTLLGLNCSICSIQIIGIDYNFAQKI
jgi:hypothetical protein